MLLYTPSPISLQMERESYQSGTTKPDIFFTSDFEQYVELPLLPGKTIFEPLPDQVSPGKIIYKTTTLSEIIPLSENPAFELPWSK